MNKIHNLYKYFQKSYGVSTDTREDITNKVFFALSGESFDGNRFAMQAIEKGALLAVIDNPEFCIDDRFFLVDDVLKTLQNLAKHHRKTMKAKVFAITGSNGKTTTKELVSAVLASFYPIIFTKGNLNNHIGVPLTLLNINKDTEIAVIEMGANHIGEIGNLCEIACPDVGMITNIGKAHLEGFGSYEGVITAKSELYSYLKKHKGHVLVNYDDKLLLNLSQHMSLTTYGKDNSNIEGELISSMPTLRIKWGNNGNIYECRSQLYGSYNFYNILAAIATGTYFNVGPESINQAIGSYVSDNNRSQLLETENNKIILDAYNANPYSLKEAINSFAGGNFDNPWLLIGDMFELGDYALEEHQAMTDLISNLGFTQVILIGDEFAKTEKHSFVKFNSTPEACAYLEKNKITNGNILIKGSRGMKMEDLIRYL